MENHTPLPWRSSPRAAHIIIRDFSNIGSDEGELIGSVMGSDYSGFYPSESEQKENIALIIRAVNSHYELLAALKDALHNFLLDHHNDHPTANNYRAIIAKAESA